MNFAPTDLPDERSHRRQIAEAANSALRGETHNTGTILISSGTTEFVLQDPRMGAEKVVVLIPLDSTAANLHAWVDRSSIGKGTVTIRLAHPAGGDCSFDYIITGTKRLGA